MIFRRAGKQALDFQPFDFFPDDCRLMTDDYFLNLTRLRSR
jgi:hypothetical protein